MNPMKTPLPRFLHRMTIISATFLFVAALTPCAGSAAQAPATAAGEIDRNTLDGKVLCGYQGWFGTPDDGCGKGWSHWLRGRRGGKSGKTGKSGQAIPASPFTFDMWPDTSEYDAADMSPVPGVTLADGSPARLYSAYRPGPVMTHFKWMRDYGIDGVFLSRFTVSTLNPTGLRHVDGVLENVRQGCRREGRVWAMMLDVSAGMANLSTMTLVNDWIHLCDDLKVRQDPRYLYQKGKPVVMVWGFGFQDRNWSAHQAAQVIDFFKNDPKYGGVYLIGGIDPQWRTLRGGGTRREPEWAKIYRSFDCISVWDAGRYRNEADMLRHKRLVWQPDLEEVKKLGIDYLPTVFPGFSWDNLKGTEPGKTLIARDKGNFYWKQFYQLKTAGVKSVFVGMFDEVDEGTAIYKVSNTPPPGYHFVTYEGLPSDWYLRLTGAATKMIRGEIAPSEKIPEGLMK